jgi:hypothetical protein
MAGNAKWLIEAIGRRHLVYFRDHWGNVHTLEPHLYVLASGNREAVIAYQFDAGRRDGPTAAWVIHDLSADLWSDSKKQFPAVRTIPAYMRERVRAIYAEASSK